MKLKLILWFAFFLLLVFSTRGYCAEKEQWSIDNTTGLHLGLSAGAGFVLNSFMIGVQGDQARFDRKRPWVAFGICVAATSSKEFLMDAYPSYTDLLADFTGCGVGVWSAGKLFITPTPSGVLISGRF